MKYRADVDGLRTIAVLAVVMYHAHLGFTGGYVGVDVFFVISGFLITSILVKKLKNESFSLIEFWVRRVKRLVPALFCMTIFTAVSAYHILLPTDLIDLGGALIAQPLLMVNVYFWQVVKGGYFGDPPELRPLLHTWSLGVEEQFYIVLPLLLVFCWSSLYLRTRLGRVVSVIALISFVLGVVLTPKSGVAAFFNLPTRAWEMLIGSLLAFAPSMPKRYREGLAWFGLALITYAIFFYNKKTPFPGTAALVPCIGTALLIWSSDTEYLTRPAKFLAHPWMVVTGLASYSIYLWHWPLIAFGDYIGLLEHTGAKVAVMVVSLALGFFSWRYIEAPFRGNAILKTRWHVALLVLTYIGVCGSIGLWYRTSDGLRQNWSAETLEYVEETGEQTFVHHHEFAPDQTPLQWIGADPNSEHADFIIWGDSHAMSLSVLLDALGKEYGQSGVQLTQTSWKNPLGLHRDETITREMRQRRQAWKQEIIEMADRLSPKVIIACGYWQAYRQKELFEDLEEAIEELNRRGIRVLVVLDNPVVNGAPHRAEALRMRWPFLDSLIELPSLDEPEEHYRANAEFNAFIKELECDSVDLAALTYQWTGTIFGGKGLYFDEHHLSDYGVLQQRELFETLFETMSDRV